VCGGGGKREGQVSADVVSQAAVASSVAVRSCSRTVPQVCGVVRDACWPRSDACSVPMRYENARPLVVDRVGVRACVLAHNPDGMEVSGVDFGLVSDDDLVAASDLTHLVEQLGVARRDTAVQLADNDPLTFGVRRYHVSTGVDRFSVQLELDRVPLSHWVASRTVFATMGLDERVAHTQGRVFGFDPIFGTHLGYTATVVTADEHLVVVRRTAKLLADGLSDSAVGDTALVSDIDGGELDVSQLVVAAAKKFLGLEPSDIADFRVALLAVRVDDSGLWVSGHMRTTLDRDGLLHAVVERSQFRDPTRCRFVPWNPRSVESALSVGDWTSWGVADLYSAASIEFGAGLQRWDWLTLP
jgi:hypothetical protein